MIRTSKTQKVSDCKPLREVEAAEIFVLDLLKNLCLTEKETIVILKDYQSPIDTVAFSKDPPGHSRRILLSLGPLKCSGISKCKIISNACWPSSFSGRRFSAFDVYANGSWDGNIKSFSFRFLLSSQNHRLWQLRTTDSHRLWRLTVNIERGELKNHRQL